MALFPFGKSGNGIRPTATNHKTDVQPAKRFLSHSLLATVKAYALVFLFASAPIACVTALIIYSLFPAFVNAKEPFAFIRRLEWQLLTQGDWILTGFLLLLGLPASVFFSRHVYQFFLLQRKRQSSLGKSDGSFTLASLFVGTTAAALFTVFLRAAGVAVTTGNQPISDGVMVLGIQGAIVTGVAGAIAGAFSPRRGLGLLVGGSVGVLVGSVVHLAAASTLLEAVSCLLATAAGGTLIVYWAACQMYWQREKDWRAVEALCSQTGSDAAKLAPERN